jgi:hypothetical protein
MNLILDDKQFPFWIVPQTSISDERLLRLRDANEKLSIERESSGELFVNIKSTATRHGK